MKLTIHYSVQNGGDGSAHPKFVESEELAEWDQRHMDEGWGESCTGSLFVEGDNLTCPDIVTAEGYYLDLLLDQEQEEKAKKFREKFFPNGGIGLPLFTVGIARDHYYGVYVGKRLVYEHYAYPEKKANDKGVAKLAKKLEELK